MKSEDIFYFLNHVPTIIIILRLLRDASILMLTLTIDLHGYFQFSW